ncbi:LacI family DNA-binding transcriptional regulator [Enterococcus thailandicus]|uniref:LacI family DNA-binding transcriptional regulator n=1 Tax=Enterococcus thailandicus TaxID=417368 RepID=UPI0022EBB13E|nr:LacI family DNA-binding transcriptional regulator [Enterococcus thailandicus]MDA3972548.1 LacI family DNA-binding transcriptional regulator [Enterococcus thailandicus]MDA3975044.1 LacI family DNA-binding transcriptional regulator [Enterococcus thailandicus]MDA3980008.1 LacI family DNA-binding transcriptional regulator [Enterococcus thailandicus]
MASIRDVAQLAGVSVGTVSRYLNGQKLRQSNVEKITSAIKALDYKENIIAKGLKNNRSFSIGLLMNSISSRFGSEVVSGIEKVAEANGYSILLSGFSKSEKQMDEKIDYLLKHSVDGLIVFLSSEEWIDMEKLAQVNVPIVSLNYPDPLNNADVILLDDRESVTNVISEYIAKGHQKIGYITAPQTDYTAKERLLGAKEAVENHPEVALEIYEGDYTRRSGYQGTKELLGANATAIFVSNYNMSLGSLECFNEQGISVKKDIAFGHYDYLSEGEQSILPQVTINPPTEKIGETAATIILERIKGVTENLPSEKQTIILNNQILGMATE